MTYRQIKWYINQVVFYGKKIKNTAPSRLPLHEVVCMCSGNSLSLHPCPWDPLFISTTLLHTPIGSLNMVKNP